MGITSLLRWAAILSLGMVSVPAFAQPVTVGAAAEAGTPEFAVGDAILYYVNGRSLEDVGGPAFNPFEIEGDGLLYSAGAFFVVTDFDGASMHEGELSIYPMYQMPRLAGSPSADTPPIIPFAFLQKGICHAGYVAGYPVPNATYSVDLTGQVCHADSVEQLVATAYAATTGQPVDRPDHPAPLRIGFDPAFPSDLDLANVVYYAYGIAYAAATADPNSAFWDGNDLAPLRDKIASELESHDLAGVIVGTAPVADSAASRGCAMPQTTELRIAFTPDRTGITLTAASASRYYAYDYDATVSSDIRITEARECATSGPGRALSRSH